MHLYWWTYRWIFQCWRGYNKAVNSTKTRDHLDVCPASGCMLPLNWLSYPGEWLRAASPWCRSPFSALCNQSDRVLINMFWSPITQILLWGSKQKKDLLKINGVTVSQHSHLVRRWQLWKITGTRRREIGGEVQEEKNRMTWRHREQDCFSLIHPLFIQGGSPCKHKTIKANVLQTTRKYLKYKQILHTNITLKNRKIGNW